MTGTFPPAVVLRDVGRTYTAGVTALADIDLHISAGSFVAVVGPSGCGKSTLLHLLCGLDEPSTGRVHIGDGGPGDARRDKRIGWMAQQPALLPWSTVLDNVALAQGINPRPQRSVATPRELLEMVGVADFAGARPGELSGGMQQRVALARTLAVGATLWLMDEPFSALDELTRETLAGDLLDLWRRMGPTVVWVTHHIPEAVRMADRLVLLSPRPGRVVGDLAVDLDRPRDDTSVEVQKLVRQARDILRSSAGERW